MSSNSCCTCAALISCEPDSLDLKTEKIVRNKTQPCCGRTVCAECLVRKPQFNSYCPFCQQTRLPREHAESSLAPSRVSTQAPTAEDSEPPAYSEIVSTSQPPPQHSHRRIPAPLAPIPLIHRDLPPQYSSAIRDPVSSLSTPPPETDCVHYVRSGDTLASLSLAYNISVPLLKARNRIATDFLLQARPIIRIPRPPYQGQSLSSEPEEGVEEMERKRGIRRFMMRTKCKDQRVAEMYMNDADNNLDAASTKWEGDEKWVKDNPLTGRRTEFRKWATGKKP